MSHLGLWKGQTNHRRMLIVKAGEFKNRAKPTMQLIHSGKELAKLKAAKLCSGNQFYTSVTVTLSLEWYCHFDSFKKFKSKDRMDARFWIKLSACQRETQRWEEVQLPWENMLHYLVMPIAKSHVTCCDLKIESVFSPLSCRLLALQKKTSTCHCMGGL